VNADRQAAFGNNRQVNRRAQCGSTPAKRPELRICFLPMPLKPGADFNYEIPFGGREAMEVWPRKAVLDSLEPSICLVQRTSGHTRHIGNLQVDQPVCQTCLK